MNELVLDVKVIIASYDEHIWYWLYRCDDEFKKYSKTKPAIILFTELFTFCDLQQNIFYQCERYYLLNKLHRVDGPAISYKGNCGAKIIKNLFMIRYEYHAYHEYQIWYQNDKIHRRDDLPALIRGIGQRDLLEQCWYDMGKKHRKNDLPALISDNRQIWYWRDKIHRENDMHAIIYYDTKSWYNKGKQHRDNDLPAVIGDDEMSWYYMGKKYRENGLPVDIYIND